jgi:uncharacterized protein (TIGR02996 family)
MPNELTSTDPEGPLLRAILAEPDADEPRLVYADWCEENGDAARAEFIRIQIEQARRPGADPYWPHWPREGEREYALVNEYGERWRADLPPWARWGAGFVRGFVGKVEVTVARFLTGGRRLFRVAPVRLACLSNAGPRLPALAACPELARLAVLDLRGNLLDADGVRALAASPYVSGLVELRLPGSQAGGAAARALAASDRLPRLRRLHLPGASLSESDARALADSPHLRGLDVLDLCYGRIGPASRQALRERFGQRVTFDD